jgi:membrane-associated protease RseP (regulator of RpoE activity)
MKRLFFAPLCLALALPAGAQQGSPARPPAPAWIGVSYDLRWLQDPRGCVSQMVVESVVPGSPAARAGVRPGDAVVAIDGDRSPAARLPVLTGRLAPGDSVRLLIDRDGSTRHVTVVADRRPDRLIVGGQTAPAVAVPAGPVVQLRGDTLIASNVVASAGGGPAPSRGYWLASADGRLTYRPLAARPGSELDRRAAALLVCADTAGRALPLSGARVEVERIQERAESLRVVITERALEHRDGESRTVTIHDLVPAVRRPDGSPPREPMIIRPEEAMIAMLRGVAGAEVFPLERELGEYFRGVDTGLLVLRVTPGSVAERSGLRPGDVITGAAGRAVTTPADLRSAITSPGTDPVELVVVRQGRRRSLSLTRP